MTYSFQAATTAEPYPVEVQFSGQRLGQGPSEGADTFSVTGRVNRVMPGCGQVTLTVRVPGLARGEWQVFATPTTGANRSNGRAAPLRTTGEGTISLLAPVIGPGLRRGGWPAMVAAGALLGLVVQAVLVARVGLPVGSLLLVTLVACIVGVVGAKLYYLRTHPDENRGLLTMGMSLQGFVIAALATIVSATLLASLPLGTVLDVSVPALLVGQAVGRIGCRFGGCCVGRATASRWGVWGADRTVGIRRIPVRLMESAAALVLAIVTASAVVLGPPEPAGWLFVAGLSAYILIRQLLFPLRELSRTTKHGRVITLIASAVGLVTALLALILL